MMISGVAITLFSSTILFNGPRVGSAFEPFCLSTFRRPRLPRSKTHPSFKGLTFQFVGASDFVGGSDFSRRRVSVIPSASPQDDDQPLFTAPVLPLETPAAGPTESPETPAVGWTPLLSLVLGFTAVQWARAVMYYLVDFSAGAGPREAFLFMNVDLGFDPAAYGSAHSEHSCQPHQNALAEE